MKKAFVFFFLMLCCAFTALPKLRFGGKDSSVTAGTQGIFRVNTEKLNVKEGIINKTEQGSIQGKPLFFDYAYFTSGLSDSFILGTFDPDFITQTSDGQREEGRILLKPDQTVFNASDFLLSNPGGLLHQVVLQSGTSLVRGQPFFFGDSDLQLEDATALLALGIQNTLNSDIILNGGVLYLQNDLSLGDDATLVGDGQVVFNNRRLSLGGTASVWRGNILWNNALDLQMNSRVDVQGKWSFYADCQINGNGNVLNIANGGMLLVYPNSRLRLSGVRLKGLGSGKIIMTEGAELYLSDVEIEMDDDYDIFSGGVYIDGSTKIITKDHILNFRSSTADDQVLIMDEHQNLVFVQGLDTHGSLTVDRVALTYDPLEFVDQYNVRPLRIQDPNHKFINIINHASIRKFRTESISLLDYSSNAAMERYAVVLPNRPVKIFPEIIEGALNYEVRVQGRSNFYQFADAREPLLFISDGVHAVYEDLTFSRFSSETLSLGADASLIFGDKTAVELFRINDTLNYRWTFQGDTVLRGGGVILNLGPEGEIVLQGENSTLRIEGITFKGLEAEKIRCLDNSSKIILKNVKLFPSDTFSFNQGALDLQGDVIITGPHAISYESDQPCTILADSTLVLRRGATLAFEPVAQDSRMRLLFEDGSASLRMEDAILSAPSPGLQLTTGRLELRKFNYVRNDGGLDANTGIDLGDGTFEHNLYIDQPSSDALRLLSGVLTVRNVTG